MNNVDTYKAALDEFLRVYMLILRVKEKLADGKGEEYLAYAKELSICLANVKQVLAEAKADCGFESNFSFLEEQPFDGFTIKDGKVIGSPQKAMRFAMIHSKAPEEGSDPYLFEVSRLLFHLPLPFGKGVQE